ncbi:MAG TPA: SRPBCC domain-containing protein [Nitrososphaeraceae archaeon]|nr:SRPBCC domain-containing protein [Nitrososphaeraceae archaeon]
MKEIHTQIDIKASAERAWHLLLDFNNYSQWNPFIRQINGTPNVGTKLEIHLQTAGGKKRIYRPTITKVEPYHELRWYGKSFIPGIFNGERIFTIETREANQNHILFLHREIFTGLAVTLAGDRLDTDMYQSFEKMNRAFKTKLEEEATMSS